MPLVLATILIVFIVGGLFFEMQTPGVGVSFLISLVASALFFVPLYIAGLAEPLDIALFLGGLLLILVEIFVVPGFGITGIVGLLCSVGGLSLALVDNSMLWSWDKSSIHGMLTSFALVVIALTIGIFGSMVLSHFLTTSKRTPAMALHKEMTVDDGYVAVQALDKSFIGQEGTTVTVLRPSGKVELNGGLYTAVSEGAMLERGSRVVVTRIENSQLYVRLVESPVSDEGRV